MTSVELPSNVTHHLTRCRAESWEAYDALTAEDGWREMDAGVIGSNLHWKDGEIRGFDITVFPPYFPRETAA